MAQLVIESSQKIPQADLISIITNASFLWERLNSERFVVDVNWVNEQNEQEICRRLDRWCQVVAKGNWGILHKRLNWDGLDFNTIRCRLAKVQYTDTQVIPEWAKTLQKIIEVARGFTPEAEFLLPTNPDNPIPFEDILLPAIKVARQELLTRLGSRELTQDNLPLSILSEAAYHTLEHSLLQRLEELCSKTLYFEFSQIRSSHPNASELETSNNSKTYYTQFVHQLLENGLLTFFQKYAVLGRLVATAVNFWVDFTAEFLQHLVQDKADIQQIFDTTHSCCEEINQQFFSVNATLIGEDKGELNFEQLYSLGKVAEIKTSLSDAHKGGQTVMLLTFESGLKLVYKPKNLGLDIAFNQFLDWCNQRSQLLNFKLIKILNRKNYGWMEYIEHQSCVDETAAKRFYQRAGMLLGVLYVLRGTDCHFENLIASGEHIVLIDMETLLQHEANLMDASLAPQELKATTTQQLVNSVLRTGLLPLLNFSTDKGEAFEVSGLGSNKPEQAPRKVVPLWQGINTDNMALRHETVTLPIQKNIPRLGNTCLSPNHYRAQITDGFEQMYRFLMTNKDVLLGAESPLAVMKAQQVRFVFRATRVYGLIKQKTLVPDCLKHGVDYSIELEHLSRAFLVAQNKPHAWPILKAELRAMEELDIPFFTASTASDELSIGTSQSIARYFQQPSYQDALNQLQALDETDLARQLAIVHKSLDAKAARSSSWNWLLKLFKK